MLLFFVHRTVKLSMDTGGVSDRKKTGQPRVVCTPQVNQCCFVKNQPKSCLKKNKAWEMDITPRTRSLIIKKTWDFWPKNDKQDNALPLH